MKIHHIGVVICSALTFSGCAAPPDNVRDLSAPIEVYFPTPPTYVPFDPFRADLYTADELLKGYDTNKPNSFYSTLDWKCYQFYQSAKQSKDAGKSDELMLRYMRLHDLSIEEALDRWLSETNQGGRKKVVGIMGGHDLERSVYASPTNSAYSDYMKVVLLSRSLTTNGFTILTAGGPGAMEAGNLGAWLAGYDETNIIEAVNELATVPSSTNRSDWMRQAFMVKARYTDPNRNSNSIGVPTWFYGFEPPNPFATQIAKYFENSLREEHLLSVSQSGIIFAPGSAGTVQEIFQSTCQNYYTNYTANRYPMILLGVDYWNRRAYGNVNSKDKPAWPLLEQLGHEEHFEGQLMISDDVSAIADFVRTNLVNQ